MNTATLSSALDPRVIDKIRKLLAIASDKSVTESEASTFAAKAQTLMEQHNLSMASVEAAGGSSGDDGKRVKDAADDKKHRTVYVWQRNLMKSIAELNFCHCALRFENRYRASPVFAGYDLIGRSANVASTRVMFDYLTQAIDRLAREEAVVEGEHVFSKFACSFREGAAVRVVERLEAKREEALRAAEVEAKEEAARRSHPAHASTTLPAVILTDFVQDEKDLNEDMRRGLEPGTTGRKRREREALDASRDARMKELQEAGHPWDVAWNVVYRGMDVSEAIEHERKNDAEREAREEAKKQEKPETEAQARKRREREERESNRYWEQASRRAEREARRIDSRGYRRGQDAGRDIGLDQQIDVKSSRRIS